MAKRAAADTAPELAALRQKITALVAQNAIAMVQQAIDAVREEGQYQAIKYLFEMIGLYPAVAQDDEQGQDSLAEILFARLGLPHPAETREISKD
jgi:type II secretory pathway pseudopilin PulG